MTPPLTQEAALLLDVEAFCDAAKHEDVRLLSQFAEEEIVVPDGRFEGERLKLDRQPFIRLLYKEFESGHWREFVVVGCQQSGKTLMALVVPLLYVLFELGKKIVFGVPDMLMGADKWSIDVLPVIESSGFDVLLPTTGEGSRGGVAKNRIDFKNGASVKFMTSGGKESKRGGFTAAGLFVTEPADIGRRAIDDMKGRLRSWHAESITLIEGTVDTETDPPWPEYNENSSKGVIHCKCVSCGSWIAPEREHLVGWQDAETELDAMDNARWVCSECGYLINEAERYQMNVDGLLVHEGQRIEKDKVVGALPRTLTCGFRWTAFNNFISNTREAAREEWRALRNEDHESAERSLRRFVHTLPFNDTGTNKVIPLSMRNIARRVNNWERGVVPDDATHFVAFIDVGLHKLDWVAMAFCGDLAAPTVVDYDEMFVASERHGAETAIMAALRTIRDVEFRERFVFKGEVISPTAVCVDARYHQSTATVKKFCKESGAQWRPSFGFGRTQRQAQVRPNASKAKHQGLNYSIFRDTEWNLDVFHVNADFWKGHVHQRLGFQADQSGAMTLFNAPEVQHLGIAAHLTSETQEEFFDEKKGSVVRFVAHSKQNHKFDCSAGCCALGHYCGARWAAPVRQKSRLAVIKHRRQNYR